MSSEPVTITCSICGNPIVTVTRTTAEAFSSGAWVCSNRKCHEKRKADQAGAEGRLV